MTVMRRLAMIEGSLHIDPDDVRRHDTNPMYHARVHAVRRELYGALPAAANRPDEATILAGILDSLAIRIVNAVEAVGGDQ